MWSFRFFGLLLLTRRRRILNLGFLGWLDNCGNYFLLIGSKAWSLYGWREEDIFRPSQFRRSLNPSSVKGFFSSLSAVGSAYGGDLCPEGILGLSHADIIDMLLGLLSFCLLRLSFGFFRLIFELLGFLQLFLKGCQLLIGSNQLVGGLAHVGRWPHA